MWNQTLNWTPAIETCKENSNWHEWENLSYRRPKNVTWHFNRSAKSQSLRRLPCLASDPWGYMVSPLTKNSIFAISACSWLPTGPKYQQCLTQPRKITSNINIYRRQKYSGKPGIYWHCQTFLSAVLHFSRQDYSRAHPILLTAVRFWFGLQISISSNQGCSCEFSFSGLQQLCTPHFGNHCSKHTQNSANIFFLSAEDHVLARSTSMNNFVQDRPIS